MAGFTVKNLDSPDEIRKPDKTLVEVVDLGTEGRTRHVPTRVEVVGVRQARGGHRQLPGPPRGRGIAVGSTSSTTTAPRATPDPAMPT